MRGRPKKIIPEEGVAKAKIIAAYRSTGSAKKAGKVLGMSDRTIRLYLQKVAPGVLRPRGGSKPGRKLPPIESYSTFTKWIKANPGVKIPHSIRGIQRKTKCSYFSIACFMYRQRVKIRKKLAKLGKFSQLGSRFTTNSGVKFVPDDVIWWEFYFQTKTYLVKAKIKLKGYTNRIFIMDIDDKWIDRLEVKDESSDSM